MAILAHGLTYTGARSKINGHNHDRTSLARQKGERVQHGFAAKLASMFVVSKLRHEPIFRLQATL